MLAKILRDVCQILGIRLSRIDLDQSFVSLGGDFLSAISLASACRYHGFHISTESIFTIKNIGGLLEYSEDMSQPAERLLLQGIKHPVGDLSRDNSLIPPPPSNLESACLVEVHPTSIESFVLHGNSMIFPMTEM